jgi:aryl-alcohol dehydrogenase-like predicted oxidoreductase
VRFRSARGSPTAETSYSKKPPCTASAAPSIAWTLHNPLVISSITGATKPAQVDENLKALDVKITPEIVTKIEAILQNKPVIKSYID